MIIIITGTPGTGKTTLARELKDRLDASHLDVAKLISDKGLCEYVDKERDCKVIDPETLTRELTPFLTKARENKKSLLLDSHLIHHVPANLVNVCVVTRCALPELKKRLEQRGYSPEKVRENVDAEIFENCLLEAERVGHKVLVVDTSKTIDWEELIGKLKGE